MGNIKKDLDIYPLANSNDVYEVLPTFEQDPKKPKKSTGNAGVSGITNGLGISGIGNVGNAVVNGVNAGVNASQNNTPAGGNGGGGGYGYLQKYSPYARYQSVYGDKINSLLDALLNRGPFNYDYLSDPMYQAYRQQYEFQGDRARENAIGDYARNTGGLASSWATTAGQLAQNNYNAQLNSLIPELQNARYTKYMGEVENDLNNMNVLMNLENRAYDRYASDRAYDWQVQQAQQSRLSRRASGSGGSKTSSTMSKTDLENGAYARALDYLATGKMPDISGTGISMSTVLDYAKQIQRLEGNSGSSGLGVLGNGTTTTTEDEKKKKGILARWAEAYGKSGAVPIY